MQSQKVSAEDHGNLIVSSITPRVTPVRTSKRSGKIRSDVSNTRECVSLEYSNTEKRVKKNYALRSV